FRPALEIANAQLEQWGRRRRAATRSIATLRQLPYSTLTTTRVQNARVLRSELGRLGVKVLDSELRGVPSHVVATVHDPHSVQHRLASEGVFAPIHWPEPDGFSAVE